MSKYFNFCKCSNVTSSSFIISLISVLNFSWQSCRKESSYRVKATALLVVSKPAMKNVIACETIQFVSENETDLFYSTVFEG